MKWIKRITLLTAMVLNQSVLAIAVGEPLEFDNPKQRALYNQMLEELRCTVCQNQSLADSNASLAQDLRKQLYTMVKQDEDREQITEYMVSRYGEFVLYRPTLRPTTYLLWFGPFLLLIIGVIVLRMNIAGRAKQIQQKETLTQEERELLAKFTAPQQEKN